MPNVLPFTQEAASSLSRTRSRASRDESVAVKVVCESPWGSYTARVSAPAHVDVAEALERLHRRVLVDLELVAEGGELPESRRGFGLASLLLSPDGCVDQASRLAKGGVQWSRHTASPTAESAVLRFEGPAFKAGLEHELDAAHVSPLCAALLGSGSRASAEACIVAALVTMLETECAGAQHARSA